MGNKNRSIAKVSQLSRKTGSVSLPARSGVTKTPFDHELAHAGRCCSGGYNEAFVLRRLAEHSWRH